MSSNTKRRKPKPLTKRPYVVALTRGATRYTCQGIPALSRDDAVERTKRDAEHITGIAASEWVLESVTPGRRNVVTKGERWEGPAYLTYVVGR